MSCNVLCTWHRVLAPRRDPVPFTSRRARLVVSDEMRGTLGAVVRSRSDVAQRVERARILPAHATGRSVSVIAREVGRDHLTVERCIDKRVQWDALATLAHLSRKGRLGRVTPEAHAWVVSLACAKRKQLGYPEELWTTRLPDRHVREHCRQAGQSRPRFFPQPGFS